MLFVVAVLGCSFQVAAVVSSCANGETDVCCHLEQYLTSDERFSFILVELSVKLSNNGLLSHPPCSPSNQADYDNVFQGMNRTHCWGSAVSLYDTWDVAPTLCDTITSAIDHGCMLNLAGNIPQCDPINSIMSSSSSTGVNFHNAPPVASVSSEVSTDLILGLALGCAFGIGVLIAIFLYCYSRDVQKEHQRQQQQPPVSPPPSHNVWMEPTVEGAISPSGLEMVQFEVEEDPGCEVVASAPEHKPEEERAKRPVLIHHLHAQPPAEYPLASPSCIASLAHHKRMQQVATKLGLEGGAEEASAFVIKYDYSAADIDAIIQSDAQEY